MTGFRAWQFAAFALKIAISAGFLTLVVVSANKVNYATIFIAASPSVIAIVIAIVIFQMAAISAWRLKLVIKLLASELSAANAARITWAGFFAEQVGAFFVAGDIARIWLLRQVDVSVSVAIEAAFVDRVIGFATITVMASLGMPRLWWTLSTDWRHELFISIAIGLTGLAVMGGFVFAVSIGKSVV